MFDIQSGAMTVMMALALLLVSLPAAAQWPTQPAPGLPRTVDGAVRLDSPPPRVDGKPDLSGVWLPRPDPLGRPGGVENDVLPRYFINIAADHGPDPVTVVQPSALPAFMSRLTSDGFYDPIAYCKPAGALRMLTIPLPTKIVQTPGLVVLLHEHDQTFREVFTDGRALPIDPIPRFMGYSIGRWDNDEFVVTSTGYSPQIWLDAMGHPHSEELRIEERYRRVSVGRMEVAITVSDPKTLKEPVKATQHFLLQADQQLLEYFCMENEKSRERYVKPN